MNGFFYLRNRLNGRVVVKRQSHHEKESVW